MEKVCGRCKLTYPLSFFYACVSRKDKHDHWCKACRASYRKEYYRRSHPDLVYLREERDGLADLRKERDRLMLELAKRRSEGVKTRLEEEVAKLREEIDASFPPPRNRKRVVEPVAVQPRSSDDLLDASFSPAPLQQTVVQTLRRRKTKEEWIAERNSQGLDGEALWQEMVEGE